VTYWFPAYGHPEGSVGDQPWFRVEGSWGYRAVGHPDGPSEEPCFRITRGRVQPTLSLPGPADAEVTFVVIGSFVYQAGGAGPPWFRVQASGSASFRDTAGRAPTESRGRPGPPPYPARGAAMRGTGPERGSSSASSGHPPFHHSYQDVNPPVDGCPACRSASICWVPGREGQTNYLCEACGRCWNRTSRGTVRVSPIDCPGCAHRATCFEHLRSEVAAFAWRPV
jgi:hypothetical protein